MKRSKTYGLAIVMALAISALVGTASASASDFRSEAAKTGWSVTAVMEGNNHKFGFNGGELGHCQNDLSGETTSSPSPTFSAHPIYSVNGQIAIPCRWLNMDAWMTTGTCEFRFRPGGASLEGFIDIKGCNSNGLRFAAGGCTVVYGNQRFIGPVTYQNVGTGSKREIIATAKAKNLTYTKSGSGCFGENGTFTNGTYEGQWKIAGGSEGKQVGVWAESSTLPAPSAFVADEAPVTIAGKATENKPIFQVAGNGNVFCSEHTLSGSSATVSSASIALSASYGNCIFLGQPASFSMGGCSYVYYPNGGFDIVGATCASNPITISAGGCTATIGPKSGLSGLTYANLSQGVNAAGEAKGITSTAKGVGCITQGTYATTSYASKDTLSATNASGVLQGFSLE